ncbi:hypothetical protein KC19_7G150800 [Ceratodon purpureus]|uniref:Uncharacterized protein n=1 Tax=Ceratodon purpureus TaxID=3225 RepID=A0A8T0HF29_CERPU|nr:hypothetical protein KC19_7G150800 [Ceratodon purpureus]
MYCSFPRCFREGTGLVGEMAVWPTETSSCRQWFAVADFGHLPITRLPVSEPTRSQSSRCDFEGASIGTWVPN